MKTYMLGVEGDRILTVKKTGGHYTITIRRKDDDNKFVELSPKRLMTINISLLFFNNDSQVVYRPIFNNYCLCLLVRVCVCLSPLSCSVLGSAPEINLTYVRVTDGLHFVKLYTTYATTSKL